MVNALHLPIHLYSNAVHLTYPIRNGIRMESGIFEPVRYPDYQWKTMVPTFMMPWLFTLGVRIPDTIYGMPKLIELLNPEGLTYKEKLKFFKTYPLLQPRFFDPDLYTKNTYGLTVENVEDHDLPKLSPKEAEAYRKVLPDINKRLNYYDPFAEAGNYIDRYLQGDALPPGTTPKLNPKEAALLKQRIKEYVLAEKILDAAQKSPKTSLEMLQQTLLGYVKEEKYTDPSKIEIDPQWKAAFDKYGLSKAGRFDAAYYEHLLKEPFNMLGLNFKTVHQEYLADQANFEKKLPELNKESRQEVLNYFTSWLKHSKMDRKDDVEAIIQAMKAAEHALRKTEETQKDFVNKLKSIKLKPEQIKNKDKLVKDWVKEYLTEYAIDDRLDRDIITSKKIAKGFTEDLNTQIVSKDVKKYFKEFLENRKIAKSIRELKSKDVAPALLTGVILNALFWNLNSLVDVKFIQPWEHKKAAQGYDMPKAVRWPVYLGWVPGVMAFLGMTQTRWFGKPSPINGIMEKLKLKDTYLRNYTLAGLVGTGLYLAVMWGWIQANLRHQKPAAEARLIQQKRLESLTKNKYRVNVPEGFNEAPLRRPDLFARFMKNAFQPVPLKKPGNPFWPDNAPDPTFIVPTALTDKKRKLTP